MHFFISIFLEIEERQKNIFLYYNNRMVKELKINCSFLLLRNIFKIIKENQSFRKQFAANIFQHKYNIYV